MAEITAQLVKDLRGRTGIAIGKCKEALSACDGDIEKAIIHLRKAGLATAVKKEGRETKEGLIGTGEANGTVAIVEVAAETDFVVQNDNFQKFLQNIADEVATTKPSSVDALNGQKYSKDSGMTIDEYRATVVQTLGENIQIKRIKLLEKTPDSSLGIYSHMGGKIVVTVDLAGAAGQEAFARDIAMHIAAESPEYVRPDEVPSAILDGERDIAKSQMKGKPENMIEKIVDGKIQKYYDTVCLLRQKFVKDPDHSIEQIVQAHGKEIGKPLEVKGFVRWSVGE